ncbi:MAG: hypothetical protein IS632_06990 [Thaumarchaeota archaeon]|nr:hypothetical protein [Nitrososphaerota archaeon]
MDIILFHGHPRDTPHKEDTDGHRRIVVDGYHTAGLLLLDMVQRCTAYMDCDFKKWTKME